MHTKTKKEQLLEIFRDYREIHGNDPVDNRTVMAWAINNDKWQVDRSDSYSLAAYDLGEALRSEHHLDPQGRKVRTNHSMRERLKKGASHHSTYLWQTMPEANRTFMVTSLQQRRKNAVGDVTQISKDMESYNDNYNKEALIQMDFNFNLDLAEQKATGSHPEFDDGIDEEKGFD